ncbi:thioredoxin family protein [uncultured Nonlabens sp.]|uniref:thioredoxin family protein n=1 Tax=uncultured Nonlabens sp. TaxID=859306 RepID=UPI002608A45E|nr:thioredoxin family protein [uncultured Nonlabens sp.]
MSKFGELISVNVPVLFNFYTIWNEDTVVMNEVLRNVAAALGDKAAVIKIDIEKNPELSEALRIKSVPTFIIFKEGVMKWRQSSVLDENTLIHHLKRIL